MRRSALLACAFFVALGCASHGRAQETVRVGVPGRGLSFLPIELGVARGLFVAWAATENRIKENPAQIKKILRATLRSIRYIFKNRDEVAAYVVKSYGVEREEALAAAITEERYYAVNGDIPEEGIRVALQFLKDAGDIEHTNYPVSRFVDFSALREVQKELQR